MFFTRHKAIEDVENTEYDNFDNAASNAEHINKQDISIKEKQVNWKWGGRTCPKPHVWQWISFTCPMIILVMQYFDIPVPFKKLLKTDTNYLLL